MKSVLKKIIIMVLFVLAMTLLYSKVYAANTSVGKVKKPSVNSQNSNSITISWKKVKGANGYKVYIYDEYNNKYVSYKATNKTKFVIKNLKSANEYKIKIKAYKKIKSKKYYGKYSPELKATTTPAKVKGISVVSTRTNNIFIKWNETARTTGYKVYVYNNSKNKYEYYNKTNINEMNINNLKSDTKYKIKIRAYRSYKGKQYYGSYSSVLDVKTKAEDKNVYNINVRKVATVEEDIIEDYMYVGSRTIEKYAFTVLNYRTERNEPKLGKVKDGQEWVIVEMKFENMSDSTVIIDKNDFKLIDGAHRYAYRPWDVHLDSELDLIEVRAGSSAIFRVRFLYHEKYEMFLYYYNLDFYPYGCVEVKLR